MNIVYAVEATCKLPNNLRSYVDSIYSDPVKALWRFADLANDPEYRTEHVHMNVYALDADDPAAPEVIEAEFAALDNVYTAVMENDLLPAEDLEWPIKKVPMD